MDAVLQQLCLELLLVGCLPTAARPLQITTHSYADDVNTSETRHRRNVRDSASSSLQSTCLSVWVMHVVLCNQVLHVRIHA